MTQSEHRRRRHKGDHRQSTRHRGQSGESSNNRVPPPPPPRDLFPEHWHPAAVRTRAQAGQCFVGVLRINSKGVGGEGYVSIPNVGVDIMVRKVDLNRAMAGDTVAIRIVQPQRWWTFGNVRQRDSPAEMLEPLTEDNSLNGPSSRMMSLQKQILQAFEKRNKSKDNGKRDLDIRVEWDQMQSPEETQSILKELMRHFPERRPTGFVVCIVEPSSKRQSLVGMIQADFETKVLYFSPLDAALPRIFMVAIRPGVLDLTQLVEEATNGSTQRTMLEATFVKWDACDPLPTALVHGIVGSTGIIESETTAILVRNGIRDRPFSEEVIQSLPDPSWTPSEDELRHRWDFRCILSLNTLLFSYRDACVFSIDPATARDLDDALSIEQLDEDTFKVGVHIADVAHFVKPLTPVDQEAQRRTTSVYLVQRVIPMLPEVLSSHLCSLQPGEDRLTFSVVWEMNRKGEISKQEIRKSIIRSCAKLAYGQAQTVIEDPDAVMPENVTLYGQHSWNHIKWCISVLFEISQHLRKGRQDNGTVTLDLPKIGFILDENGFPDQTLSTDMKDANRLIQEFMLLANMSVAKFISDTYPKHALLRCHPPPSGRKLAELGEVALEMGIDLDVTSAASLQQGLHQVYSKCNDIHAVHVITNIATKPMQLAEYFCTGAHEREQWRHYALAVDQYTHFTSPIRRYPDIVVHRWLEMAINDGDVSDLNAEATQKLESLAAACNKGKVSARTAQDASLDLFLMMWLEKNPVETTALVSSVKGNRFFDIYVPRFSFGTRILCEEFPKHIKAVFDRSNTTLILVNADKYLPKNKNGQNGQQGQSKQNNNGRKIRNHRMKRGNSNRRKQTTDDDDATTSVRVSLDVRNDKVILHLTPSEVDHRQEHEGIPEKESISNNTEQLFVRVSLEVIDDKACLQLIPIQADHEAGNENEQEAGNEADHEAGHEVEDDISTNLPTVSLQLIVVDDRVMIDIRVLPEDLLTTAEPSVAPQPLTNSATTSSLDSTGNHGMSEDSMPPLKLPSRLKRFSRIPIRVSSHRCPVFRRLKEIKVDILFEAA